MPSKLSKIDILNDGSSHSQKYFLKHQNRSAIQAFII